MSVASLVATCDSVEDICCCRVIDQDILVFLFGDSLAAIRLVHLPPFATSALSVTIHAQVGIWWARTVDVP